MIRLGALALLLSAVPAQAYVIKSFDVEMTPRGDSALRVKEVIKVDFGSEDRRGLYREIPIRYQAGMLKFAFRFHLDRAVADHSRTSALSRQGRKVAVRIGDADRTVTGVHAYSIEYTVERAVLFLNDHDEIYWNVTGNDWLVPIERATFTLQPPKGVRADQMRTQAYTGETGRRGGDFKFYSGSGGLLWRITRPLKAGEGLTVVAGFPKGHLKPPSRLQEALWWLADNALFFLGAGLPIGTLLFMLALWRRHGVDPDTDLPIMTEYLPPEDLSPAEVGTLFDESADDDDVMSTMFDLAARGFIRIEPIAEGDMRFHRQFKPGDLRGHEVVFLDALFGNSNPALLSDARLRFSRRLDGMKDSLYRRLVNIGFFAADPRVVRSNYLTLGIACSVGVVALAAHLAETWTPHFYALAGGGALSGIIVAAFARAMPRKTDAGAKAARRVLGFKEFVVRAEKERIEWLLEKDPAVFERLLPYALVLGVGTEWVKRFDGLLKAPPSYYDGGGAAFVATSWYDDMHDRSRDIRTAPPPPSSDWSSSSSSSSSDSDSSWGSSGFSDSSSSSSGSSGGGSSGGGGGGGGGGAW